MANDPNLSWQRAKAPHENFQNVGRHLRSSTAPTLPVGDPTAAPPPSTAELLETIKQMQATINGLSAKLDALSKPAPEDASPVGMPPLSTNEIDDIVTTRLLSYVAEQTRPSIMVILNSGKATAYDFIDRDLKSETFGMFLSQEEIVKKIEDLTRPN